VHISTSTIISISKFDCSEEAWRCIRRLHRP
jgi:hypothetical protein